MISGIILQAALPLRETLREWMRLRRFRAGRTLKLGISLVLAFPERHYLDLTSRLGYPFRY